MKKEFATSLHHWKEIVQLDTLHAEAYLYCGFCHYRLQQFDEATRYYQKALELNPEFQQGINNNQGLVYVKQGKFKEAKELFSQYEQVDTTNGKAYRNWAVYYALQNKVDEALLNLQKAVHLGYGDLAFLLEDESLESIRGEIEFKRLVKELEGKLEETK